MGEVGIRVVVPNYPVWLRLGYRIERQRATGGREDVLDGLTVLLGAGAR